MLLLFPQGGGTGVVNYGVSDSLGVRIDEGQVDEIYIETPDTLRIAISDVSTNAAAFTRTDTLSVRIADTGSVSASGTTPIAGTDTLSVTITDAAGALSITLAVTDTLSVQISDASSVSVTQEPIAASDTMSLSILDSAVVNNVANVEQVAGDILGIRFEDSGDVTSSSVIKRIRIQPNAYRINLRFQ